jgi:hypothetical protein
MGTTAEESRHKRQDSDRINHLPLKCRSFVVIISRLNKKKQDKKYLALPFVLNFMKTIIWPICHWDNTYSLNPIPAQLG